MKKLQIYTSRGPASHDLAFEAEMLHRAAQGEILVAAVSWPGPVVVLGYGQPPEQVDLELCAERGIPVLRRLSGGTGVIHRRDLGFALALPSRHPWATGIVALYERFLDVLEPALRDVGSAVSRPPTPARATRVRSPICFLDQLADTLAIDGRKAVGCSQTRRKGAVLIHAAVLLELDASLYAEVFGIDETVVHRGLTPAVGGIGWADVAAAVVERLAVELGLEPLWSRRPRPDAATLEPYALPRWSPVPDGGIPTAMAKLV